MRFDGDLNLRGFVNFHVFFVILVLFSFISREMLLQFLDEHCMKENQKLGLENSEEADEEDRIVSAFDFLYLPIDFEYVTFKLRTPELQFILRGPY